MSSLSLRQWRLFLGGTVFLLLVAGWRLAYGSTANPFARPPVIVVEEPCPHAAQGLSGEGNGGRVVGRGASAAGADVPGHKGANPDDTGVPPIAGAETPAPEGAAPEAPGGGHQATVRGGADPGGDLPAPGEGLKVDINRAGVEELQRLPGIGPVLAARIVAHREQWGPFQHPVDLLEVSGIGRRTFERLADYVVAGDP